MGEQHGVLFEGPFGRTIVLLIHAHDTAHHPLAHPEARHAGPDSNHLADCVATHHKGHLTSMALADTGLVRYLSGRALMNGPSY